MQWLNDQPSWSDFPIVLLTHQGGGPERNPDAVRLGQVLGNVIFHRAAVSSDHAGQHRWLRGAGAGAASTRPAPFSATSPKARGLLQTALNAGHLGTLELPSAGVRAGGVRHLQGVLWAASRDEAFTYQDLLAAVHPDDRATPA